MHCHADMHNFMNPNNINILIKVCDLVFVFIIETKLTYQDL